jgi:hypothetical protein
MTICGRASVPTDGQSVDAQVMRESKMSSAMQRGR